VLIEEAGAGQHLWQDLRHRGPFRPIMLRPAADKVTRMVGQLGLIEDGDVLLPDDAPWLPTFISELRAFPTGRHDDQVDSLAQFLDWSKFNSGWARAERDPKTGRKLYVQRR
jgi:predicted phage terminase large subunit-like protein